MDWKNYERCFKTECAAKGKSLTFASQCLQYAKNLNDKKVPIIYDQRHFSMLVGYSDEFIRAVSNSAENFYSSFHLPKKKGGFRVISVPLPSLMETQRWVYKNILSNITVSKFAKAYRKGESIINNARFHRGQKIVLKLDIEDFFGSLAFKHVFPIFLSCGYTKEIAVLLANICLLKNKLPQGAPTSPVISNIAFVNIDNIFAKYAISQGIRYTRYSDDMTFSGSFTVGSVVHFVEKVLNENSFKLNHKKTRVLRRNSRQIVTGIITNEKLNAPRELRRKLSQISYYIQKYGLENHMQHCSICDNSYLEKIIGKAHFVKGINKNLVGIDDIVNILREAKGLIDRQ